MKSRHAAVLVIGSVSEFDRDLRVTLVGCARKTVVRVPHTRAQSDRNDRSSVWFFEWVRTISRASQSCRASCSTTPRAANWATSSSSIEAARRHPDDAVVISQRGDRQRLLDQTARGIQHRPRRAVHA